jgi:outer membrane protein assembly factor BamB
MKATFFFFLLSLFLSVGHAQTLLWKSGTEGMIYSSPVTDGQTVFIGSEDGHLYAFEPATGKPKWKFRTEGAVSSTPCISRSLVFITSRDGSFYAIEKNTGKLHWKFTTEGERIYDTWDYYLSGAVVSDETVFFGSGDGHIYALNQQTGQQVWKFKTGDVVHATPVVYNDKVYVGSFDGFFYVLSKDSGKLIWKFDTIGDTYFPKGEIQKAATVANNIVYFGSRDYNIYALDAEKGTGHWNMKETGSWIISTPFIKDKTVYFGTSDTHAFYASDATNGTIKWKLPVNMRVYSSCISDESNVYFGCFDGKLYAVNRQTGEIVWIFQTENSLKNYSTVYDSQGKFQSNFNLYGENSQQAEAMIMELGAILSTPLLHNGILYFGSTDGNLYALKL